MIQTKVAMVMKCRSEMFASKLFWMYLRGQFDTKKVYIESAPPVEFDTSCANPQKDQPDKGKVQKTETGVSEPPGQHQFSKGPAKTSNEDFDRTLARHPGHHKVDPHQVSHVNSGLRCMCQEVQLIPSKLVNHPEEVIEEVKLVSSLLLLQLRHGEEGG